MQKNNGNAVELNLDELACVSGGTSDSQKKFHCPVHTNRSVIHYDNGRYKGGNLTRYKCARCTRLYSLTQVEGSEDLTIDYTNIKFD
jgi:hypothetical protein